MSTKLNMARLAGYLRDFLKAATGLQIKDDCGVWVARCELDGRTRTCQFTPAGIYGDAGTVEGETRSEFHLARDIAMELRK